MFRIFCPPSCSYCIMADVCGHMWCRYQAPIHLHSVRHRVYVLYSDVPRPDWSAPHSDSVRMRDMRSKTRETLNGRLLHGTVVASRPLHRWIILLKSCTVYKQADCGYTLTPEEASVRGDTRGDSVLGPLFLIPYFICCMFRVGLPCRAAGIFSCLLDTCVPFISWFTFCHISLLVIIFAVFVHFFGHFLHWYHLCYMVLFCTCFLLSHYVWPEVYGDTYMYLPGSVTL